MSVATFGWYSSVMRNRVPSWWKVAKPAYLAKTRPGPGGGVVLPMGWLPETISGGEKKKKGYPIMAEISSGNEGVWVICMPVLGHSSKRILRFEG